MSSNGVSFLWWYLKAVWSSTFLLQVWHLDLLEPVGWVSSSLLTIQQVNRAAAATRLSLPGLMLECQSYSSPPLLGPRQQANPLLKYRCIIVVMLLRPCHVAAIVASTNAILLSFWSPLLVKRWGCIWSWDEQGPFYDKGFNAMKEKRYFVPRVYPKLANNVYVTWFSVLN